MTFPDLKELAIIQYNSREQIHTKAHHHEITEHQEQREVPNSF